MGSIYPFLCPTKPDLKREMGNNGKQDMADKTEQRMTGLKYYTAVY